MHLLSSAQAALLGREVTATQWADTFNGGSLRVFKVLAGRHAQRAKETSYFAATRHGFTYKMGLNVDHLTFNPSGACQPGGLYFCTRINIPKYALRGYTIGEFDLCADSRVYVDPCNADRPKADRMTLIRVYPFSRFMASLGHAEKLAALSKNGYTILHIPPAERTDEMRRAAVKQNGWAIQYLSLEEQNDELRLAAVSSNGMAIQHISPCERTDKIMLAAVTQSGRAIQYLSQEERTDAIRLAAVMQDREEAKYLEDCEITEDIRKLSVSGQ